jgi:NADH:ubiquinone oxidoreductase subunit
MSLFSEIFVWWDRQTMGTRLFTWRKGERVGEDGQGNVYYRERGGERRWVIYAGAAEASRVPPEWHGWLHRVVDEPPGEGGIVARPWEKPHRPNMTGTAEAYRPEGSTLASGKRPPATGDYEAWSPAD